MRILPGRPRTIAILGAAVLVVAAGYYLRPAHAQNDLTPGMLFGPVFVDNSQRLEICSAYLSEGELTQFIHFRNLTSGESTAPVKLIIKSGGGACATYSGVGLVVGMARGEGQSADWVSPSNALIGTMSVKNRNDVVQFTVIGLAKLWLKGL